MRRRRAYFTAAPGDPPPIADGPVSPTAAPTSARRTLPAPAIAASICVRKKTIAAVDIAQGRKYIKRVFDIVGD